MSLVGFKAQNHPQQRPKDEVDDRAITDADFGPLHARFGFTIDAAASPSNAKLPRYWTRDDDALSKPWRGERVWCNPPYSNLRPWVVKAHEEWLEGCPLTVILAPNNRFEQGWWQDEMEGYRLGGIIRVEFLRGRMRFDRPGAVIGPKGDRPPFGCCLLIWRAADERQRTAEEIEAGLVCGCVEKAGEGRLLSLSNGIIGARLMGVHDMCWYAWRRDLLTAGATDMDKT